MMVMGSLLFLLGMGCGVGALIVISKACDHYERNDWDDGPAFE